MVLITRQITYVMGNPLDFKTVSIFRFEFYEAYQLMWSLVLNWSPSHCGEMWSNT